MSSPQTTPTRIDLKRDERLLIAWADGKVSTYSISLLRTMCPCATCRETRAAKIASAPRQRSLTVLPGNFAGELRAESAELVGNYAMRIEWSDKHASGIYSFQYLREIST
jgi:DUF971 family protein